jgi:hypothetical protein
MSTNLFVEMMVRDIERELRAARHHDLPSRQVQASAAQECAQRGAPRCCPDQPATLQPCL